MKALLDEQLSPAIAELLCSRGHDVQAVGERADLAGQPDRVILETGALEKRVVITNNVKDFRPLAADRLARGRTQAGLILLPSKRNTHPRRRRATRQCDRRNLRRGPNGLQSSER